MAPERDPLGPEQRAAATMAAKDETTCRIREVLDRVGDKWTLAVVYELGPGPRRFTELKRALPGISQRMLTVTLRTLERDGLVERTVFAVVPPQVVYELTALGQTMLKSVWPLIDWLLEHLHDINEARQAYDGRAEDRGRVSI